MASRIVAFREDRPNRVVEIAWHCGCNTTEALLLRLSFTDLLQLIIDSQRDHKCEKRKKQ